MSMSAAALQQVEPYELPPMQAVALYDGLTTLVGVLDALLCQPRFSAGPVCNAAGEVLSHLRDQVAEQAEAAMAAAERSEPRRPNERLCWAEARLHHAAQHSDDVEALVAFARSLTHSSL